MSPRKRPPPAAERDPPAAAPKKDDAAQAKPHAAAGQVPGPGTDAPDASDDQERARMERTARYLKGPTSFSA